LACSSSRWPWATPIFRFTSAHGSLGRRQRVGAAIAQESGDHRPGAALASRIERFLGAVEIGVHGRDAEHRYRFIKAVEQVCTWATRSIHAANSARSGVANDSASDFRRRTPRLAG
jgi:hypothetical protein